MHSVATFSQSGAAVDPAAVQFVLQPPGGNATVYTTATGVVKETAGVYHFDVNLYLAGVWRWAWLVPPGTAQPASVAGQAAAEGTYQVRDAVLL